MKKLIAPAIVIIVIAALTYFLLGGSEEIHFEYSQLPSMHITGQYVEGKYNSKEVENAFYQAKNMLTKTHGDKLVVVNYPSDSIGFVKQFIGVLNTDNISAPADMDSRTFTKGGYVTTVIQSHNLVMPKPADIRNKAYVFAQGKNLQLEEVSIEMYFNDRELKIAFPVKSVL